MSIRPAVTVCDECGTELTGGVGTNWQVELHVKQRATSWGGNVHRERNRNDALPSAEGPFHFCDLACLGRWRTNAVHVAPDSTLMFA